MAITEGSTISEIGRAGSEGSVVMAENAKSLLVANSTFDNNLNTYVRSEGGPTNITASNFTNGSGSSFVSVVDAGLAVGQGSVFSGNENPEGTGLGIQCSGCTDVAIQDTEFDGFLGATGAAVSFSSSCNVDLDNVGFNNSTATKGAALHVADSSIALKSGTSFNESKSSEIYTDSAYSANQLSHYKGTQGFSDQAFAAINFECSDPSKIVTTGCNQGEAAAEDACAKKATCCIEVAPEVAFARNDSFVPVIPPIPEVPPYPRTLTYNITKREGFTRQLNVTEFAGSKAAAELADRLEGNMSEFERLTWKRNVMQHYEITSGVSFDLDITLLLNNEVFNIDGTDDTTAQLNFFKGAPDDAAKIRSNLFRATGGVYKFATMVIV